MNAFEVRNAVTAGGYGTAMTLPNHDLSTIADPGSMNPDAMTEPDNGNPGAERMEPH
jgi:hypothetical protein